MLLLASAVISVLMHQFDDAVSITVVRNSNLTLVGSASEHLHGRGSLGTTYWTWSVRCHSTHPASDWVLGFPGLMRRLLSKPYCLYVTTTVSEQTQIGPRAFMACWRSSPSRACVLLQAILIVVTVAFVQVRAAVWIRSLPLCRLFLVEGCSACLVLWTMERSSVRCPRLLPFLRCPSCPALPTFTFKHLYWYYIQP